MRDVLDDNEGKLRPLSLLLLALTFILGGMIVYNAMVRNGAAPALGSVHVEVMAPRDSGTTVVIKYDPLVEDVQRELLGAGIYRGMVDGVIGDRTKNAIIAYQQLNGLTLTGEVSAELVAHIKYTRKIQQAAEFTGSVEPVAAVQTITPQVNPPAVTAPLAEIATSSDDNNALAQLAMASTPAAKPKLNKTQKVQAALKSLGYKTGPASGSLDGPTKAAILKFEMDKGLAMSGTIDDALLHALRITAN